MPLGLQVWRSFALEEAEATLPFPSEHRDAARGAANGAVCLRAGADAPLPVGGQGDWTYVGS